MDKSNEKVLISISPEMENTIRNLQRDGGDMAETFIEMMDELTGYFLDENVTEMIGCSSEKVLEMIRLLQQLKHELKTFV
jgi:hypothetical protein